MKIYNQIDNKIIEEIKSILDNDGLIIIPTDTVYGIACNAFSDKAINKLFKVKQRDKNKPINVLSNSIEKLKMVVKDFNYIENKLIKKYFPGALTIICQKKENVSSVLTANLKTIGIRIPNNDITLNILAGYPYPLAVTSANISGEKTDTNIQEILNDFKDNIDIFIDGGDINNLASTIVKIDNNQIIVLRQGDIVVNINNL